jgi:hypothetical protein
MKTLCCGLWAGIVFTTFVSGQGNDRHPVFDPPEEYPLAVNFFAPLFFPKILQDEFRLKEYICSNEFTEFRRVYGDLHAVDAIFDRAMKVSWNNVYEALLLSFVCTIEHRNFGVKLPLIGPLLWVPLTSEFPDEFQHRVRALPSRLFSDTPLGFAGDRDKLQHFFGSAFITYTFESREASQRIGMFVEWGEDKFVVEGSLDERDIRANVQGQEFGSRLLDDASLLPSGFLGKQELMPSAGSRCVPEELLDTVSTNVEDR